MRHSGRDVQRRVLAEEAVRLERELGVVHGHDRPVLRAGEVRRTEGVPQHDVFAVDRGVVGDVLRDAVTTRVLVHEVAGGVPLRRVVLGHEQVLGRELGARRDR